MTEQEQMQEVVEKMPEVFSICMDNRRYMPSGWHERNWVRYTSAPGGPYRIVHEAQHAAWIEKKLMEWLEDKGFDFKKVPFYGWYWTTSASMCWECCKDLWPCLYAAFKHWEEQQKPTIRCTNCGHDIFLPNADHVPAGVAVCDRGGSERQEQQKPKEKGLREKIRLLLVTVFPSSTAEEAHEKQLAAIMQAVAEYIKSRQGKVEEAVVAHTEWKTAHEKTYVTDLTNAIMAAFGKETSDE